MPYVIPDFIAGKRTDHPTPQRVTVVRRDESDQFFGTTPDTRSEHLRGLRDLGLLVHQPGRLTRRIPTDEKTPSGHPKHERVYVLACEPEEVPRRRRARRPRERVLRW